jgi:TIR domain/Calcineurin-like phosphoesterase
MPQAKAAQFYLSWQDTQEYDLRTARSDDRNSQAIDMDTKVFISFRSEDTAGYAQAIMGGLKSSFPGQVFLDNVSIAIGDNLVETIKAALLTCRVMIVLIGKDWCVDRAGRRRLIEPKDYVRLEVSTAIKQKLKILPVLVQGAKMPEEDELPGDVRVLHKIKAGQIDHDHFEDGMEKLVKAIEQALTVPARARERGSAADPISKEQREHLDEKFEPLPAPVGSAPYHLPLESVVSAATMQTIIRSGRMVFHVAGCTGNPRKPPSQRNVIREMRRQCLARKPEDRPAFLYHLGDIVYFLGEPENYYAQFYKPYDQYPAAIVAIPGNHDGAVGGASVVSLDGFMRNFCAVRPQFTDESRGIARYAMTQPNPYWTLETPLATFVGLYTNLPEGGMLDIAQKRWLVSELKSAPADKPLILNMHHLVYSLSGPRATGTGGHDSYLGQVLDSAEQQAGRHPDLVLSAHAMNYQRFTRSVGEREVPYIVAGAGGYPRLHRLLQPKKDKPVQVPQKLAGTDVVLQAYCDDRHGFVRFTLDRRLLRGEYFAVSLEPGASSSEAELVDSFALDLGRHRLC